MKLSISSGSLYADNLFLCLVGAGNGRTSLPDGRYKVATQYSHAHGTDLPNADGLGWIGTNQKCDVVLEAVRGNRMVTPAHGALLRLLALLEAAEERGKTATLVIA